MLVDIIYGITFPSHQQRCITQISYAFVYEIQDDEGRDAFDYCRPRSDHVMALLQAKSRTYAYHQRIYNTQATQLSSNSEITRSQRHASEVENCGNTRSGTDLRATH